MKFIKPTPVVDPMLVSSTEAENDYPAWSATKIYVTGDNVINSHRIYESVAGAKSTATITIASPGVATWSNHGLAANTPVVLTTTGALPTGLTAGTTYYVRNPATNTFELSATSGGTSINTSGTQSGTHTVGLAANYNKSPATNDDVWLDIGPTNRWAMFDSVVGTKTVGDAPLTVVIDTGIIDSLVLIDLYGSDVQVTMTDGAGGPTVFDQNFPLPDGAELLDWYDYFFADIEPTTQLIVSNLPPYGAARLTVTINGATTVECGTLVIGKRITCGQTLTQPTIGIQDYSRKEVDQFGNYSVIERSFSKRIEARFWLESNRVDYVAKKLAEIRATPVVWLADDDEVYESLVAFGYYRDWGIDIVYPNYSEASLSIEGLT